MNVINQSGAPVAVASASHVAEMQSGTDCLFGIYAYGTPNVSREAAYVWWLRDPTNSFAMKAGSDSVKYGDSSLSWTMRRLNVSGPGGDDVVVRLLYQRGMVIGGIDDNDIPSGVDDGTAKLLIRYGTAIYRDVNGMACHIAGVNTSTGASAISRFRLGNNASIYAFTIDLYGGNHSDKPNYARIIQQMNAPLELGAGGDATLRLPHTGGLAFVPTSSPTSQTGKPLLYFDSSSGPLKVKYPDGSIKTFTAT